uniref:Putative ATP-dependent RNA helicase QP509L n=2 Tax=African swine fever virus TaxID=10497 RepID=VF509_ASFWA|nr:RecName: Full=Putative ATP-dependent RNA helicase QP509L [African swine fever virus warthog/Namibia/Wart80/1980]
MEAIISFAGIGINYKKLQSKLQHNFGRLLKALTVTARALPGQPKHIAIRQETAFTLQGEYIYFPILLRKQFEMFNMVYTAHPVSLRALPCVETEFPLFNYQQEMVDKIHKKLLSPYGRFYLHLNTGLGKTRIAISIIQKLLYPTLVIVPTKAIQIQWIDELTLLLPHLRVAAYNNAACKKKDMTSKEYDVIVGIINTLRKKPEQFFEPFGLVVLDEAHELHSPENYKIFWKIQLSRILGLSATPLDRPDGMDKIIIHHLGQPQRTVSPTTTFSGYVREIEYQGHPDFVSPVCINEKVSAIATIDKLLQDPSRIQLVVNEAKRLYSLHTAEPHKWGTDEPYGIIIFVEFRKLLEIFYQALSKEFKDVQIIVPEVALLCGGVSNTALSQAHSASIILLTYGYGRRGISFKHMTSIIMATPRRNNMEQILGRITRQGSDEKKVRIVVDIKDTLSPLSSQVYDRHRIYKKKGYPIFKCSASYQQPYSSNEVLIWDPYNESCLACTTTPPSPSKQKHT